MNLRILRLAAQLLIMAIIISVILLFVGIGFLVLLHLCMIGRSAFRREDRGTTAEGAAINGSSSGSMSKDDLEKLPCYDYSAKDSINSSPVECAVCLESLEIGDKCRLLPLCKHSFHAECVDVWLLKTPICPICRTMASSCSFDNGGLAVIDANGHSGTPDIELGERQLINDNDRGGQLVERTESGPPTDVQHVSVEIGENANLESPNSGQRGGESRQQQDDANSN